MEVVQFLVLSKYCACSCANT